MAQKIAVFGKTPESEAELKKEIRKHGFAYDYLHPDIVISYGGDGTFLWAERAYPSIPKALFRYSTICKKCHNLPIHHALILLKERRYKIENHPKIRAGNLIATNDVVIRNKEPTHAVRFTLAINGKQMNKEFIGDGIVIATPFGSTGYFYSITRKTFTKGLGIAFNNTTEEQKPLFIPANSTITLSLKRGTAVIAADNNPKLTELKPNKRVTIRTSKQKASIITF